MTKHQQLFIDGQWVDGNGTFAVRNPFDGSQVADVEIASAEQAQRAVDCAQNAMRTPIPPAQRANILRTTSDLLTSRSEEISRTIQVEAGKPITAARAEVNRAVQTFRIASEEARRLPGETIPFDALPDGRQPLGFTVAVPKGVVAAITPFNFPLNLVSHKVAPALAAGCSVVLKPSERTPLTAGLLTRVLSEAGLPPGWLNLVTGRPEEIVSIWQNHPDVAVITFTGSADVGWALKAASPRKHHILELGSNTAVFVAPDANLELAVDAVTTGGYNFSGQACISIQRVYVHHDVHDEFVERLAKAVDGLATGNPADESTVVGPLVSAQARDRVQQWLAEAIDEGATVAAGGHLAGTVLTPTVLTNVPTDSRVMCEEIFGPVVCVKSVTSLNEGISEINSSRYGLNTAIFTASIDNALSFARTVESGAILINISPSFRADHMPYGGVKDSGQGREGVKYAVEALLEPRLIVLAQDHSDGWAH